jgi:membrane-associated phospholipid phosphatase
VDAGSETFFARASVVDRLNLAFLVVPIAFAAIAWPRLPHPVETVLVYAGLVALVFGAGRLRAAQMRPRLRAGWLFLYSVAFLFAAFESLALVMPYVQERRYDAPFAAADAALFGGAQPAVVLREHLAPWMVDALYAAYLFYFPMPLIVLAVVMLRGRWRDAERWMAALLVCYYGAYACYFALPAIGPRFHLAELASPPQGVVLAEPIRRLIDVLEPNKLDCFPSLHAAILFVTLVAAKREAPRLFLAFLPVAALITLSLVALGYHWVVDVLAGFLWAPAAVWLSGRLFRRLETTCRPHFGTVAT